jgi:hypothetical protein
LDQTDDVAQAPLGGGLAVVVVDEDVVVVLGRVDVEGVVELGGELVRVVVDGGVVVDEVERVAALVEEDVVDVDDVDVDVADDEVAGG